ncbi:arsenate reductase [Alteraurantiacibacter buctensis]|uniref:Spx/MgsR family RNA polymerase-binding regulatory protein n=1 Tax=Alteraurantiacibacter buctensis TaxID=1503981 RepID=A0A844YXG2_9SPHN|nr:arsenate reductase [Alteraurantiacibacter buctensis]MXO70757.1 Spx/MgsR family RNA polymerase-binding regulatory protein [Alteraurantiacibacter buctensis]
MTIALYGIPNCDTVKKARTWLDGRGLAYTFHDYKKEGADAGKVAGWIAAKGVDTVLNRRGTTFRKLSDAERAQADSDPAGLMVSQPSLIKRPVAEHPGGLLVGFDVAEWERALG